MMFKKTGQFFLIFMLSIGWIFSSWPQVFNFPPNIGRVWAAPPIPSYRASGTFTAGTGAITPPYPASMVANDICLLTIESENQTISLSSAQGFVEVANSPQSAGTAATDPANRIAVYWKKTVGGDTAPTVADSGDHTTGQIHCFFNVTTSGNPWDVTAGGNDGGSNDTSGVIPGATTGTANTLVVLIQGNSRNGTGTANCSSWSNADLANLTERTDNTNTAGLGGGHCMATGEKATAGAYTSTTVTLSATTFKGAMSIALKPLAPTYTQSAYRLFNNANSTDVGSALAAQDTAATLGSVGAAFRLRMLLHVGTDQLPTSGENFKLQFAAQSGTCDTSFSGESYADVTGSTVIAYNNNASPADGDDLTANANDPTHSGDTIVNQDYEEANNFTNTVAAIPVGQDGKWDFALIDNSAPAGTAYCFRLVKSDGSQLNTYSVIPQVTTASPVYSVSITSSGTIEYGFVALSTASSTVGNGYTQTAQNDGNTAEKLNVKSSNATGGTTWTLASSIGNNQYKHEFSTTTGSIWTAMPDSDTYVTAAPSVAQSGTVNFDFRLTTPSSSTDYQQKTITITVQAVAP